MLLNAKWVITPPKLCAYVLVHPASVSVLPSCLCVLLCAAACVILQTVCVGMYYELVCCIDEDIWCFHMRVSWFVKSQLCD